MISVTQVGLGATIILILLFVGEVHRTGIILAALAGAALPIFNTLGDTGFSILGAVAGLGHGVG